MEIFKRRILTNYHLKEYLQISSMSGHKFRCGKTAVSETVNTKMVMEIITVIKTREHPKLLHHKSNMSSIPECVFWHMSSLILLECNVHLQDLNGPLI